MGAMTAMAAIRAWFGTRRGTRWVRWFAALVVGGLLLESGMAAVLVPLMRAQAAETTRTGVFATLFRHLPDGATTTGNETTYRLIEDNGTDTALLVGESVIEAAGGAFALERRRVTVVADVPVAAQSTGNTPLFVKSLAPEGGRVIVAQAVTGSRRFLNVLCKYAGSAVEPEPQSYFAGLMSSANSVGLDAYWREVSYNTVDLTGSVATAWGAMANTRSYYTSTYGSDWGRNAGLDAIATDCIQSVASTATPNDYQGINLIFNDALDGYAWGGTGSFQLNGTNYTKAMTWMPPWGYHAVPGSTAGVTVMSHEMGHAFGFRHSANPAGATYQSAWDVMSGDRRSCGAATLPTYGCLAQHTIGSNRVQAGWLGANRLFTYNVAANITRAFTLTPIEEAGGGAYLLGVVPRTGSTRQTTIELRRRVGRDARLLGDAVIIHDVQMGRIDPAWVQGTNGDAGAMFTQGASYPVPGTALTVTIPSFDPTSARIVVSNGVNPTLTGLSTTNGRSGAPLTLTGTNLSPEATVTFGLTPAASVSGATGTGLTVVTPALADGTYPITVTNPDGRTATIGGYTAINVAAAPGARAAGAGLGAPAPAVPMREVGPPPAALTPTPRPAPTLR